MAKKKRANSVRTTISLPAELRKRMKACGESMNWSAIAAQAFTAEVARLFTQKEDAKLDDVIERLKATAREEGNELFESGRDAGENWAKRYATKLELKRLNAAFAQRQSADWLDSTGTAYTEADIFVWQIRPEDQGRVGDDFFKDEAELEDEHKDLIDESAFVHGFAAGAIVVWRQVADRL